MASRRTTGSRRLTTIKQVADEAGVSRATVSRAFGQPHLLNRETAERVKRVARQLGYEPNQTARALSTGRAGNIALIVPDITNPFFSVAMRGAQAKSWERGYAMFLGDSDETPELEDLLLTKLAAQVEGFVLASSRLTEEQIRRHATRRPLVLLNREITNIPRLLVDADQSYEKAVEHLAELGHRSLAYVNGPPTSWSNRQKKNAVRRAAQRHGLRLSFVSTSKPTFEAGQACTEDLLRTGATGVLAFDDVTAQGIMSGLATLGLSVPKDMSVVGCDGIRAKTTYPTLSSIDIGCYELGERGVDLLLSILGGKKSRERIVLPAEFVVRSTTAAAPRQPRRAAMSSDTPDFSTGGTAPTTNGKA